MTVASKVRYSVCGDRLWSPSLELQKKGIFVKSDIREKLTTFFAHWTVQYMPVNVGDEVVQEHLVALDGLELVGGGRFRAVYHFRWPMCFPVHMGRLSSAGVILKVEPGFPGFKMVDLRHGAGDFRSDLGPFLISGNMKEWMLDRYVRGTAEGFAPRVFGLCIVVLRPIAESESLCGIDKGNYAPVEFIRRVAGCSDLEEAYKLIFPPEDSPEYQSRSLSLVRALSRQSAYMHDAYSVLLVQRVPGFALDRLRTVALQTDGPEQFRPLALDPVGAFLRLGVSMCCTLVLAHRLGIFCMDVHAGNWHIRSGAESAVLVDFGSAILPVERCALQACLEVNGGGVSLEGLDQGHSRDFASLFDVLANLWHAAEEACIDSQRDVQRRHLDKVRAFFVRLQKSFCGRGDDGAGAGNVDVLTLQQLAASVFFALDVAPPEGWDRDRELDISEVMRLLDLLPRAGADAFPASGSVEGLPLLQIPIGDRWSPHSSDLASDFGDGDKPGVGGPSLIFQSTVRILALGFPVDPLSSAAGAGLVDVVLLRLREI